ncbi:hypothetical protein BS50DRAFT_389197 [Corynespora cassiicola Philippines]|uniref:Uncharacterized protein n=1 Tax=Corynespora cassiicola Philippines TaxID=1448308 RepID=A0A2T2NPL5_CORCC|nr:hypothetical protein BS50DRAFT_389197 [Corynespora cassiicola Philippines]
MTIRQLLSRMGSGINLPAACTTCMERSDTKSASRTLLILYRPAIRGRREGKRQVKVKSNIASTERHRPAHLLVLSGSVIGLLCIHARSHRRALRRCGHDK